MLSAAATAITMAATVTPTPAPVTAAAPTGSLPFDITQVLQFGLLGLIFLCLVFRKFIVPEWTLKAREEQAKAEKDDLQQRLNDARDQLDQLQTYFRDQLIPTLTRATEINARYTDELAKARYRQDSDGT